jgi:hypothetical protein
VIYIQDGRLMENSFSLIQHTVATGVFIL